MSRSVPFLSNTLMTPGASHPIINKNVLSYYLNQFDVYYYCSKDAKESNTLISK